MSHRVELFLITARGYAVILCMWLFALAFMGGIGIYFLRLLTPESWWQT